MVVLRSAVCQTPSTPTEKGENVGKKEGEAGSVQSFGTVDRGDRDRTRSSSDLVPDFPPRITNWERC